MTPGVALRVRIQRRRLLESIRLELHPQVSHSSLALNFCPLSFNGLHIAEKSFLGAEQLLFHMSPVVVLPSVEL